MKMFAKKSRIRETKHLFTDADSSTDTLVWWTKNNLKPNLKKRKKKSSKTQKNHQEGSAPAACTAGLFKRTLIRHQS